MISMILTLFLKCILHASIVFISKSTKKGPLSHAISYFQKSCHTIGRRPLSRVIPQAFRLHQGQQPDVSRAVPYWSYHQHLQEEEQ